MAFLQGISVQRSKKSTKPSIFKRILVGLSRVMQLPIMQPFQGNSEDFPASREVDLPIEKEPGQRPRISLPFNPVHVNGAEISNRSPISHSASPETPIANVQSRAHSAYISPALSSHPVASREVDLPIEKEPGQRPQISLSSNPVHVSGAEISSRSPISHSASLETPIADIQSRAHYTHISPALSSLSVHTSQENTSIKIVLTTPDGTEILDRQVIENLARGLGKPKTQLIPDVESLGLHYCKKKIRRQPGVQKLPTKIGIDSNRARGEKPDDVTFPHHAQAVAKDSDRLLVGNHFPPSKGHFTKSKMHGKGAAAEDCSPRTIAPDDSTRVCVWDLSDPWGLATEELQYQQQKPRRLSTVVGTTGGKSSYARNFSRRL